MPTTLRTATHISRRQVCCSGRLANELPRTWNQASQRSRAAIFLAPSQNARHGDSRRYLADLPVIAGEGRKIAVAGGGDSIALCNSRVRTFAGRLVHLVAKQQTAALLATLVDYAVMAACASGGGMPPALATACGALVGTFVGFVLGRRWVFRAVETAALGQAWRYLTVSLVSLVANAAGEALLVDAGLHYLTARPIISTAVGLGWNLPMQQFFVFRRR